ncbi:Fatty-acid-CoA ligase FadD7 [Alloactinosynnema sp. L-07]|uniref:class I adenylate-forming enzyme family protein n=1 Tax=Alloactinosynnema sp. L-07 TaxID=1653480 RepID=UPI00065EF420|nr:class I adenylate-forming enzyme family protein [Alloactinosynnema sp. L-07]CRK61873.1 Fatty-acid-CoA ligase FadD7 [Alloactinosynnema sp. L-07]
MSDYAAAHTYQGVPYGEPMTPTRTVIESLAQQVRVRGDQPVITTASAAGEQRTMTFADLDRLSARTLGWLRERAGVEPGAVVAIAPANDATSVLTVLALLRGGNPTLLLNPTDPDDRVRRQVAAVGATAVLRSAATTFSDGVDLVDPDAITDTAGADAAPDPLGDALYIGTSGSTAASKIVAQSYYNAAANAAGLISHHALRPGDRVLGCLPIHHVNGLHFTVFGAIIAGAHVLLADAFRPFGYPRLLDAFRPRIASVVPSILEALHQTWRSPTPPPGLEYFVSAAAPLTSGTARAVLDRVGVPVLQGYGLTETTNFSATMPRGLTPERYRALMVDTDIPSIGVAFPGNEVAVLGPDGHPVPFGEVGELCMRGHNVMNGYLHNPDATREAFAHGWFHSQDLGYQVRDEHTGQVFHRITGRSKNIAKVGGTAVSLDEMDRFLRDRAGIRDAACVSVPHPMLGEEVVVAVVLDHDTAIGAVRDLLGTAFAAEVLPTRVVPLAAIPRTPTGKVLRPQLAELLAT